MHACAHTRAFKCPSRHVHGWRYSLCTDAPQENLSFLSHPMKNASSKTDMSVTNIKNRSNINKFFGPSSDLGPRSQVDQIKTCFTPLWTERRRLLHQNTSLDDTVVLDDPVWLGPLLLKSSGSAFPLPLRPGGAASGKKWAGLSVYRK